MRNFRFAPVAMAVWFSTILSIQSQELFTNDFSISAAAAYRAGTNCYDSSDWVGAAAWWRKATASDPQLAEAWYNLALTYYQMGDFIETERHLEKVFAIQPFYENAYTLLGMALYNRGAYERAILAFNFALENTKPKKELRLAKALCYIAAGKPKYALPDLDDILYDDPGHIRACLAKSAALMDLGQHPYALRFLNRILDNDPENLDALTNRAICLFKLGKYEEAAIDFNQALSFKSSLTTLLSRAQCHLSIGQYNSALADVKAAISLEPKASSIYRVLGEIEMSTSRQKSAIESFDIALDLDPECTECLLLRSEARAYLEDYQSAINDLYTFLSTDPNDDQARQMLLWIYGKMDRERNVEK